MAKGLKAQSSTVAIGFSVTESGANTFTQSSTDLNLDPLGNEVFVVQGINLDPIAPDAVAGTNTQVKASLTTTSQTAVTNLSNSNCLATAVLDIRADAASLVPFTRTSEETPMSGIEYIGIIATNDFFIQVQGTGNAGVKQCFGKLYGYRARADASVYAALVQSEVLSA
jgi:hypothetical protein